MELARFRSYRSPPMKSAECSRDSAQWHGSRRDHEGIESAPVRRRRRGRAERNSDGDRAFEFGNANLGCEFLDDAPYGLLRYALPPSSTRATHAPKKRSASIPAALSIRPPDHTPKPGREWFGRDRPFRSVHDCAMPFALLQVAESQLGELMATESAGQRDRKQRPLTFTLQPLPVLCQPPCVPVRRATSCRV
jgi:hypothetical protein